ncbi:MAG: VWA-like domain-containing protein [Lachnospiraceae bacterium]|nr:VWA-like domain-containing protein [Lachnospiraceae bacterium]
MRDVASEIQKLRMTTVRKAPFYGDILVSMSFLEDRSVPTAVTDGVTVRYNPDFLGGLTIGEQNYIIMHEVMHVLLRHPMRAKNRRADVWNAAADYVVNSILDWDVRPVMRKIGVPFDRPKDGLFAELDRMQSAESLYDIILRDNPLSTEDTGIMNGRATYREGINGEKRFVRAPENDLAEPAPMSKAQEALMEERIKGLIQRAAKRGTGSYSIPPQLTQLLDTKKPDWRVLMRDFLDSEIQDEVSYATPERKYLHMDLILPGHPTADEELEELWAFVDSSGSIGKERMDVFLSQLYRISREFHCIINLCFWDTRVTDVYRRVIGEKNLLKCVPTHSGGTDVNCIYDWLRVNKIRPEVMLILTDGEFGPLDPNRFLPYLRRNTLLVLSEEIDPTEDMKRMGKVAWLKDNYVK